MRERLSHLLLRLYPRAWRERYGDEFLALLETRAPSFGAVVDTLRGATRERAKHAFEGAFGKSHDEHVRRLRRYARAATAQVIACAVVALVAGFVDRWFDRAPAPIIHASTWTPAFFAMFVIAVLEISATSYALGAVVLWVRRKHSPYAAAHGSSLMTITIGVVVGSLASGLPANPWSIHLSVVNSALGHSGLALVMVAQWAVPAGLSSIRPARPSTRVR